MASAAVRFHPAAAQEAESTYDWYAARSPEAAHGFREELGRAGHCRDRDEPPNLATLWQPRPPIRISAIPLQPGVHPSRRGHRDRGRGPRSSPSGLLAVAPLISSLTSACSGRRSAPPLIRRVSQTAMGSTSAGEIEVAAANGVDDELIAAFNRLIPQLSRSAAVPSPDLIREIVEAQANTVLIARDSRNSRRIVGLLTLVVFRIPTGVRAWIEDVVVDEAVRGRGVGEALSQEAVRRAVGLGARTVELTSRPSREAANRLYQRLGFVRRDSNVYRYTP